MKRIAWLATAALATVALAGAAQAADLPRKAPVAPYAAPFSWTGFYIGAHVGWGWSKTEWSDRCFSDAPCVPGAVTDAAFGPLGSYNLNGFLGGGQLGYNWQAGWAVFGVEADASGTDIKGSGVCIHVSFQCSSKIDALGTITARFGGAVDRALLYVKGGGAWVHEKHTVSDSHDDSGAASETRWGWTVGAGLEYAFAPNWSGKVEYNFLDFGKDTIAFPPAMQAKLEQTVHTVKFGINYRFGERY
jgi:outer membrane immunogenic protein